MDPTTHSPSSSPRLLWYGIALLCFPLFMCGWKFAVDIAAMVVSYAIEWMRLGVAPRGDEVIDWLRPDIMGLAFFLSIGGIVVGAWLTGRLLKWDRHTTFALHKPSMAIVALATTSGFVVGVFPGWLAQILQEQFPALVNNGALEMVEKMLLDGPLFGRLISILAICVGAPFLEELIFRGFLWTLIERFVNGLRGQLEHPAPGLTTLGGWTACILTSGAFALFHMDPIQSTALLFTAFILGWLRLVSGSIWPCVLLHFVNNSWATILALSMPDMEMEIGFGVAAVCAATTVCCAALCWPFRSASR